MSSCWFDEETEPRRLRWESVLAFTDNYKIIFWEEFAHPPPPPQKKNAIKCEIIQHRHGLWGDQEQESTIVHAKDGGAAIVFAVSSRC